MKIALLNALYSPHVAGGTERVVQTLAQTLLVRGHEPVVVCTGTQRGVQQEHVDGVRVYYVGLRNVYPLVPLDGRSTLAKPFWHAIDTANVAMMQTLGRILDQERPAVFHTHNLTGFSALAWSAARDRHVPIVHTLHDYYLLCPRSTMFTDGANCEHQHASCSLYSWPRVKLSSLVRSVVGVSRFVLDRHLEYGAFSRAQTFVIGNPCVTRSGDAERQRGTAHPLRIGYLGRLEPAKGVEQLVTAAAELDGDHWELHIAGRGASEFERRLRATIVDRRVQFHGFVDRDDFLKTIDVLVVPSLSHETFGLVAIEAFAAGVPVVASRRGGLGEVVTPGVTGMLFEPNQPGTLRTILNDLVADPSRASKMRDRCLERARQFDAAAIAARYESVYHGALPA